MGAHEYMLTCMNMLQYVMETRLQLAGIYTLHFVLRADLKVAVGSSKHLRWLNAFPGVHSHVCMHVLSHTGFFFFFLLKEGFAVEPKLGFELSLSCPTLKSIFILPVAIEYLRVPVFVAIKFQSPFYLHGCVAISRFVSFSFLIFETRLMRYTLAFENLVLDHVWILE